MSASSVGEYDYMGNFSIGLDSTGKYLLFFREYNQEVEELWIDLTEVKDCRLINVSRLVNSKSPRKVVDKLELNITYADPKKTMSILRFYNSDESMQQNGELLLINKWSDIIKDKIASA